MLNDQLLYRPRLKVIEWKDKNPKYWYRYYLPVGKTVKRFFRPAGNDRRDAEAKGKRKEAQLLNHVFDDWDNKRRGILPPTRFTIVEAVDLYLGKSIATYSHQGKASVAPTVKKLFTYFIDQCGRTFLDEITEDDFLTLRDFLLTTGFKKATKKLTVHCYQKWLNTAFNWFVKKKYIERNPLSGVTPLRLAKSERVRNKVIQLHEWKQIMLAPTPKGFGFDIKLIATFTTATGFRLGEILHLRWSDIDLVTGEIRIRVKPDCPTRNGMGWRPKWDVEGEVPLNPVSLLVLESIEKRDDVVGVYRLNGQDKMMATDFVFFRKEDNRYVRIDTVRRAWAQLLKNAGLAGKYTFKDLRSTANTYFKIYCQLTQDEASRVMRNSPEVNQAHYTNPILLELKRKMLNLPPEMKDTVEQMLLAKNATVN